jgi:hypothetical protein
VAVQLDDQVAVAERVSTGTSRPSRFARLRQVPVSQTITVPAP